MVGFGSSLRMCRRRGWEDAYLDYASLRLLLTQIEAVYEEEDYKCRDGADEEEKEEEAYSEDDGVCCGCVAISSTGILGSHIGIGGGGTGGCRRRGTCLIKRGRQRNRRKRRRRHAGAYWDDGGFSAFSQGTNFLGHEEHYETHPSTDNISDRRRGRSRNGNNTNNKNESDHRALDKGGWRSPGVVDYRDELFLESDSDVAFDYDDDKEDGRDSSVSNLEEEGRDVDYGACENEEDYDSWYGGDFANNQIERDRNEEYIPSPDSSFHQSGVGIGVEGHHFEGAEYKTLKQQEIIERSRSSLANFAGSGRLEESFDACVAKNGDAGKSQSGANEARSERKPPGWMRMAFNVLGLGVSDAPESPDDGGESSALHRFLENEEAFLSGATATADTASSRRTSFLSPSCSHTPLNRSPGPSTEYFGGATALPPPAKPSAVVVPASSAESATSRTPVSSGAAGVGVRVVVNPSITFDNVGQTSSVTEGKNGSGTQPTSSIFPDGAFFMGMSSHEPIEMHAKTTAWGLGGPSEREKMMDSNELTGLLPSSSAITSNQVKGSNILPFYALNDDDGTSSQGSIEDRKSRRSSNMFSFYSQSPMITTKKDGWYLALNSPASKPPSIHPPSDLARRNSFIFDFLFGKRNFKEENACVPGAGKIGRSNSQSIESGTKKKYPSPPKKRVIHDRRHSGMFNASLNVPTSKHQHRLIDPTSASRRHERRRRRSMRHRRRRRRRRAARVPEHLKDAHVRAAAITEIFLGLLRAEVEKVILFANSRLGELSDTLGSLRFPSYDDGQDVRRKYPNLADGGMHPSSSSDDEDGGNNISCCMSSSTEQDQPCMNNDLDESVLNSRYPAPEKDAATKRQILLRDRLRISRPLFQKAEFLGDDFFLLSAVDEVDAYSAVGVELMHLLKFICVNVIATRKICLKHDKLMNNRMLGGYHHRRINNQESKPGKKKSHQREFGGTLSSSSSRSTGIICGVYDTKIQLLANSTTMQTVSSSLAIALDEFEASQSRSAQLGSLERVTKKNKNEDIDSYDFPTNIVNKNGAYFLPPKHDSLTPSKLRNAMSSNISGQCFRGKDDDSSAHSPEGVGDDDISSSSNTSLTRLQFCVTSVFGLREASRIKRDHFEYYASRLFMASTGPNVSGDGLDGCSRETLDFLCSYDPDAAYTLDGDSLYSCLRIRRDKDDIRDVMVASLAAAAKGSGNRPKRSKFRSYVSATMSIKPEESRAESEPHGELNILRFNTFSSMLYTMNYYVITPSANSYAEALGSTHALVPALIGAANLTAIVSAAAHALIISKRNSFIKKKLAATDFRVPLLISAFLPIVGNLLYSYASSRKSIAMAIVGRLLVGFGSAELINRQLLSACVPQESLNSEVSKLVKKIMSSTTLALIFGALFDVRLKNKPAFFMLLQVHQAGRVLDLSPDLPLSSSPAGAPMANAFNLNPITAQPFLPPLSLPSPLVSASRPIGLQTEEYRLFAIGFIGYLMSSLWLIQFFGLIFFWDPRPRRETDRNLHQEEDNAAVSDRCLVNDEDFDSGSEMLAQTNSPDPMNEAAYDIDSGLGSTSGENLFSSDGNSAHGQEDLDKLRTMARSTVNQRSQHTRKDSIENIRRLVFSNVALPTTIALLCLAKTTTEVLLSSCATVVVRYANFDWTGASSGLFMGIVTSLMFPINFGLSLEKDVTERNVMKFTLGSAKNGLLLLINYRALFLLLIAVFKGIKTWKVSSSYDGNIGVVQYVFGFLFVMISVFFLESSTLSLMSKVAPCKLRKYSLDCSFWVTVVSSLGRLLADFIICAVELSSWLLCSDIINSLCFCLIIAFMAGSYILKKHYFFLI